MIRVVLVDGQNLVRTGIRSPLELDDGIRVVGEAADGEQALGVIGATQPDVVLLDIRMCAVRSRQDPGSHRGIQIRRHLPHQ